MSIIKVCKKSLLVALFSGLALPLFASELTDAQALFKKNCSFCHAIDKKKLGPAVNAMNKKADFLRETIAKGRKSMPAYAKKLTSQEIDMLVEYLLKQQ